ncbi:STAS-like domain-containing protein [Pasteurellaceae bacterium HPA106]|uniref:STAS-like domain-containing protein n=1 Tax=Spirabiliibacterium pneumoniae TaxID=221400 RepID=UPI001AAD9154|nr:STAS-like domain-containing protein [Spirabiliibacterium pneumoniae]MBE2895735.1 STAS-like domain-containing protein [Spirabiliibacterium pneumoniae]
MNRILVKNLIESNISVSMVLGAKLYQEIKTKLSENNKVKIDFEGIDTFASPFFNAAIGKLLKDYSIEQLQESLDFLNINQGGKNLLNKVIANAIEYYKDPNNKTEIAEKLSED